MKKFPLIILHLVLCIPLYNCDGEHTPDPNPAKDSYLDFETFNDEGLLCYLPFNDNLEAYSSNELHLYGQGELTYIFDRFDHFNSACYFNGSNTYISFNNDDLIKDTTYTICFWYKPYFDDTLKHVIISNADTSGIGITLSAYKSGDSLNFEFTLKDFWNGNESSHTTGSSFSKWIDGSMYAYHFAAVSFNKSEIFDYQTGNKITVEPEIPFNNSNWRYRLTIGGSENKKVSMFKGALDDFLIYNRYLTTTEIETIYNLRKN